MRCPSCGALQNNLAVCVECSQELPSQTAASDSERHDICRSEPDLDSGSSLIAKSQTESTRQASRLIEFPGIARSSIPLWRKEVAERVREAQERKAREAVESRAGSEVNPPTQLELLSQTESTRINPIVAAALKRIERAYTNTSSVPVNSTVNSTLAAVAYAQNNVYQPLIEDSLEPQISPLASDVTPEVEPEPQPAKAHNLVVVATAPRIDDPKPAPASDSVKRRRIISDDQNNPALNYLDSVPMAIRVEDVSNRASVIRRIFGSLVDLLVLTALCSPLAIGVKQLEWQDPQVFGVAVSSILLVGFLYSTISTAFTGRTLGMRILKLRVIDSRTGLIPTGSQSAGRSLLYLFSLVSAGLLLVYALVDSDRRTAHDKFTKTDVIVC